MSNFDHAETHCPKCEVERAEDNGVCHVCGAALLVLCVQDTDAFNEHQRNFHQQVIRERDEANSNVLGLTIIAIALGLLVLALL